MNSLKKNILNILLVLLFIGTNSCDKVDDLLTFSISTSTEIPIKKTLGISLPFDIPTPSIKTNSDSEFDNNNTSAKLVKNVLLDELKLSITTPNNKTFSFLKDITIYISTTDDNEIELASKFNIPDDLRSINLDVTDAKLDEYIKTDSYNLRTKVVTREILGEDVVIKADMVFIITANPF